MKVSAPGSRHIEERGVEILQHALGLRQHGDRAYRNHYVTGPGSADFDSCRELVNAGLMIDRGTGELFGGGRCFTVTAAGREIAHTSLPKPRKQSRSQRRYQRFLEAESGLSFGEWLRRR